MPETQPGAHGGAPEAGPALTARNRAGTQTPGASGQPPSCHQQGHRGPGRLTPRLRLTDVHGEARLHPAHSEGHSSLLTWPRSHLTEGFFHVSPRPFIFRIQSSALLEQCTSRHALVAARRVSLTQDGTAGSDGIPVASGCFCAEEGGGTCTVTVTSWVQRVTSLGSRDPWPKPLLLSRSPPPGPEWL